MPRPSPLLLLFVGLSTAATQLNLPEHAVCKQDSPPWTCQRFSSCLTARNQIRNGNRPDLCGFVGREAVVCCQPEQAAPPTPVARPQTSGSRPQTTGSRPQTQQAQSSKRNKSKEMCKKYSELVYSYEDSPLLIGEGVKKERVDNCAITEQTLITEGTNAEPKEFPHMVQIGYGPRRDIAWRCGGTLINEFFVLSAAHCSYPSKRDPARWAKMGELDWTTDKDDDNVQILGITRIINHPGYVKEPVVNDIALYRLEQAAALGPYVRPACLPSIPEPRHRGVIASGWGQIQLAGPESNILQKVNLFPVSGAVCNKSYDNKIQPDSMMCAGSHSGGDACGGDSGGPLQIVLPEPYCMYAVVGVTSFGRGCGRHPGVYTRVSYFLPWIEDNIW